MNFCERRTKLMIAHILLSICTREHFPLQPITLDTLFQLGGLHDRRCITLRRNFDVTKELQFDVYFGKMRLLHVSMLCFIENGFEKIISL